MPGHEGASPQSDNTRIITRARQIAGACLFVGGAFVAREAFHLKLYTSMGPGPGFFPLCLAILFMLLAAGMALQATVGRAEASADEPFAMRAGYVRMGAVVGAMIAVIVLLEPLGFRLTIFLFLAFLLTVLGRQRVLVTTALSLLGSFGVYPIFVDLLAIPLPVGILGL